MHLAEVWYDSLSIPGCALVVATSYFFYHSFRSWHTLSRIPTVGGPSAPILSYIGAWRFLFNGVALVREGHERYKLGVYKMASLQGWIVAISGRDLAEEARRLPDSVLSIYDAMDENFAIQKFLSQELMQDPWHIDIMRNDLPKKLPILFPSLLDEVSITCQDILPAVHSTEWTPLNATDLGLELVWRASQRILLGPPMCRDREWKSLTVSFTRNWVIGSQLLRLLPGFLRGLAAKYFNPLPGKMRRATEVLRPIIEDYRHRIQTSEELPETFLSWMVRDHGGNAWRSSLSALVQLMMATNFASIEVTSMMCAQMLLDLAAHMECIGPLREEVEDAVERHGWSPKALSELPKLDSFMRESNRYHAPALPMTRLAMRDHMFSNGITVPKGTFVSISSTMHFDDNVYEHANEFLPFRHIEKAKETGETAKHQFISTSADYVSFGLGKHVCPGRTFAAMELKTILAYIVVNYDVRTEVEGVRPRNWAIGPQPLPDSKAKILFRKRRL